MMLASLSIGCAWLYVASVTILGEYIGGMYIGLSLLALSFPVVVIGVFLLLHTTTFRRLISTAQFVNVSLAVFAALGTFIVLDIGYSVYLNDRDVKKPRLEESRLFDSALVWGELYPRLYFPTESNFRLHKPNVSLRGAHFGNYYSPELTEAPTLAKDVLELKEFSCNIDQHGFRATTAIQDAEVMALGDSFTFGWAVDAENSWVGILEHTRNLPIYNLGIHDASPWQEVELLKFVLRSHATSLKPKTILWMIYEGNDLEGNYDSRKPVRRTPRGYARLTKGTVLQAVLEVPWLLRHESVIARLIHGQLAFRFPGKSPNGYDAYVIDGIRSWYPFYRSRSLGPRLFYPQYIEAAAQPASYVHDHPNRPILDTVFEKMAEMAKEFHFKVVVIIAPTAVRLHGPHFEHFPSISSEAYFIDYVSRLSDERGFQTIDLLPELTPYADKELLYFRDDDHWNKQGHAVVADIISRRVFRGPSTARALQTFLR